MSNPLLDEISKIEQAAAKVRAMLANPNFPGSFGAIQTKDYDPACCHCETCRPVTFEDMRFPVCPLCGNKRCPHSHNHIYKCSGSNDTNQVPELI